VLTGDERDDVATGACAAGTARAVHVGLLILWGIEVDHTVNTVNVDATGGDIGPDQDLESL
jgi:hypothetical protein